MSIAEAVKRAKEAASRTASNLQNGGLVQDNKTVSFTASR